MTPEELDKALAEPSRKLNAAIHQALTCLVISGLLIVGWAFGVLTGWMTWG